MRAWVLLVALAAGCSWDWDRLEPDAVAPDAADVTMTDDAPVATDVPVSTDAATCPGAMTRCGEACVDTQTDRNNCGACGNRCRHFGGCVAAMCR